MMFTAISDDLIAADNFISFGGRSVVESAQLVQADLACTEPNKYIVYPKFVIDLPLSLEAGSQPYSSIVGRASFKYAREVGDKGGVAFSLGVYLKNAKNNFLNLDCLAFDKTVDNIRKHADNHIVGLEGRLRPRVYVHRDGDTRLSWGFLVSSFNLVGGRDVNQAFSKSGAFEGSAKVTALGDETIPF